MSKLRGIYIRRKDRTVEPDKDGKYPIKWFIARVNTSIPPEHKMLRAY